MPPSRGLKGAYPSTFCEWVVGTTIESALASRPKKQPPPAPRQREIVRFEVTTDDETEEDSLKVTYPRSGRAREAPPASEKVVKKVRFEVAPVKPALKKTVPVSSESEGETSDSAESSKSAEDLSEADSSEASVKKPAKTKKSKRRPSSSDSGTDSDPHPTCLCSSCVRGRLRLNQFFSPATDSEVSSSEAEGTSEDKSPPPAKSKKKASKKTPDPSSESSADDEASDSTSKSQIETEDESTKKDTNKKKQGDAPQSTKKKGTSSERQNKESGEKTKTPKEPEAPPAETPSQIPAEVKEKEGTMEKGASKKRSAKKKTHYPEAYLAPHPRRPQLIEPIRAEVVQTERVIETPEDPPPNAYYDPAHNILRVYHGPVYGNNQGYALYPRRDPSSRPLPVGVPHPTQNPYYHGFGQSPQQHHGGGPITQGMPVASYTAMCPPPGLDPAYLGGLPMGFAPVAPQDLPGPSNGTRGAFSTAAATTGSPRVSTIATNATNNVAPRSVLNNPYIPKRDKSIFSTFGSRVPSNTSQKKASSNSPANQSANNGVPGVDGAGEASAFPPNDAGGDSQAQGGWGNSNQQQNTWGSSGQGEQSQGQPTTGGADANQTSSWGNGQSNEANATTDQWNNGPENNNGQWDNDTQANDVSGLDKSNGNSGSQDTANDACGWGSSAPADDWTHVEEHNNVMPCSFPGTTAGGASWGDASAAASTGGQYDKNQW